MAIINFLKSLVPNIVFLIGIIIAKIAGFIEGIATIFTSLSITLHMVLDTSEGKKLKEIEKTTQTILSTYNNLLKKIEAQRSASNQEENKLAKVLKKDKNVISLQKKEDSEG